MMCSHWLSGLRVGVCACGDAGVIVLEQAVENCFSLLLQIHLTGQFNVL